MSSPTFQLPPSMRCSQSRAGRRGNPEQASSGCEGYQASEQARWSRMDSGTVALVKVYISGLAKSPPPVTTAHHARHTLGRRGPSKTAEWQPPQPAFLSKVPVTAAPSPFLQVYSYCILSLWVHCLPFSPHLTRMTSPFMPEGEKG